jgi:outer membrane protein OmpA-like peptidoglycan-associated protein
MNTTARSVLALLLLLMLAVGCRHRPAPTPPVAQSVIILLPNDQGRPTGSLVVSNAAGSQQLADPYSAVKVGRAGSAPSAPVPVDAAEVQRLFGDTLAFMPAPEARFNLYFQTGGTVLTAESAAELPQIMQAYSERRSTDVTIIGHTDTVGDSRTNYQLALQRAEHIRHSIQALGVSDSATFIESHGENDLLVPTPDEVAEPRNRRVEVIVR